MTELVKKQVIFVKYLGKLIQAFPNVQITIGEAWRSEETCFLYAKEGKGIPYSCHELRLACDINIFINGEPSKKEIDYEPLGDYWKKLPRLYPPDIEVVMGWGGDFTNLCDFYHFSIEHNGHR